MNLFFKIKWPDEDYKTIDDFVKIHSHLTLEELEKYDVIYRQDEKAFKKIIDESLVFSNVLKTCEF